MGVMGDCEVDLPKLATVEGNFAVSKTLVFNNTPAFSNLTTLSKKTTSLQTLVLASRCERGRVTRRSAVDASRFPKQLVPVARVAHAGLLGLLRVFTDSDACDGDRLPLRLLQRFAVAGAASTAAAETDHR